MSDQDFGGLIRRQRDQLGLSANRVAELIGRAPSTVRNWERGRSVPSDAGLLSTLAAVLAIPEAELFAAAGFDAPVQEHAPTIEQSLSEIAPSAGDVGRTAADVTEPHLPGIDDAPEPVSVPETRRGRARHVRPPVESEERPVPVITIPPPAQPQPSRSYLEDPGQRLFYRLRWAFTLAGLFVTFVILAWAGGHLLSALGEFWDALFGGL